MLSWIQNIDWAVLHWIWDTLQCGALDVLMPIITTLGNGGAVWLLAAIAMLISKKHRRYGLALLAGLLAGVLIGNLGMKNIFARPRPCWLETVQLLIASPTDYSFPSGHTLASVIGAYTVTAADRKFGIIAIPLAALVAFSRLYLYVHFPSDVLASVVLGTVIASVSVMLFKRLKIRDKS